MDIFRTKNDISLIFLEQKMIYHGYFQNMIAFSASKLRFMTQST